MHMARYFRRHGYETVLSGIQHEAPDSYDIGYDRILQDTWGRDMYIADVEETDTRAARLAADYISGRSGVEGNFFLSVGLFCTHRSFPEGKSSIKQEYIVPPSNLYDCKENREDMVGYIRSAAIADRCFGIVLDSLRRSGLEDNTIVVFTTDHGIAFPFMKCTLYDTGIGVAFMIKYPGNPTAGTATDALVSHIDLFPTLCELCGVAKPEWLQGVSLTGILSGEKASVRDSIFAEVTYHASYEPMRCIRTERYKLIRRFDYHGCMVPSNIDNGKSKQFLLDNGVLNRFIPGEMLFDLYLDPMERENLIGDRSYLAVYNELSEKLSSWMEDTKDPLVSVLHRVPAPSNAKIRKLTCIHPEECDLE